MFPFLLETNHLVSDEAKFFRTGITQPGDDSQHAEGNGGYEEPTDASPVAPVSVVVALLVTGVSEGKPQPIDNRNDQQQDGYPPEEAE